MHRAPADPTFNLICGISDSSPTAHKSLGMSFLKRLKSFEMREGALTISW
jgi:hypothetical protein